MQRTACSSTTALQLLAVASLGRHRVSGSSQAPGCRPHAARSLVTVFATRTTLRRRFERSFRPANPESRIDATRFVYLAEALTSASAPAAATLTLIDRVSPRSLAR